MAAGGGHARLRWLARRKHLRGYLAAVLVLLVAVGGWYLARDDRGGPADRTASGAAGGTIDAAGDPATAGDPTADPGATPTAPSATATATATAGPGAASPASPAARNRTVTGSGAIPDGWPTAGNTGWRHTGVTLTRYTGPMKITAPTVIDGKDITGCLVIQSSGVTIRRSRITGPGCNWVIEIGADTRNVVLEDVEITSVSRDRYSDRAIVLRGSGTATSRNIVRRAHIHDVSRGILYDSGGRYVLVENSLVEVAESNPDAHIAAMTIYGVHEAIIRKNTLDVTPSPATSGIVVVYPDWGDATNVTFEENLLNGSGYWSMQIGTHLGPGQYFRFRDNLFGTKYGDDPYTGGEGDGTNSFFFCDPGVEWTNNRWWAPGTPRHLQISPIDPQCA